MVGVGDASGPICIVTVRLGVMVGEVVDGAVLDGVGVRVAVASLDSSDVRVGTMVTSGVAFVAVAV